VIDLPYSWYVTIEAGSYTTIQVDGPEPIFAFNTSQMTEESAFFLELTKFISINNIEINQATAATGLYLKNITNIISEIKKPLYIYKNFKLNKLNIYKDHKIKTAGIYCLINNINGHFYIGCSVNIKNRMSSYLSTSYLIYRKNSNQPIIKALLKYSPDKFSLIVIEHILDPIGPEGEELLFDRESFWILKLCPYYNVLKFGGVSTGYKHSLTTKLLMRSLAKERKLSVETKVKISESLKGELNPFYNKTHTAKSIEKIINKKSTGKIYIYNSYRKLLVIFPSVTTFCKSIKGSNVFVNKIIKSGKLFRGEWYITKTPFVNYSKFANFPLQVKVKKENAENKFSNLLRSTQASPVEKCIISSAAQPIYSSYLNCFELIEEIKKNNSIKQPIFVYDLQFNLISKYSGIIEAESKLKIRHEKIKQHALSQIPYSGSEGKYIFSLHRLLV
jgi:group I intron endonuclease